MFLHTDDEECAKDFGKEQTGYVFFRSNKDGISTYMISEDDSSSVDVLNYYIKPLMLPTLFEFTEEEYEAIFSYQ